MLSKTCLLIIAILVLWSTTILASDESTSKSQQVGHLKIRTLENFGLGAQVAVMDGYNIRARRVIVPSGTRIEEHEHTTNPGIVYVESGSIVEYRGKIARTLNKGDSLIEDVSTAHSYVNQSTEDCVLIAFDLPKSNRFTQ
jgi:quercetin dioxygenase-like cupin family protein